MTTRLLCLWIPNWPVQRRQARQPELRDRPLVLFAVGRRGQEQVVTHCRRAAGLGVSIGMPLAEAKTLFSDRRNRAVPCFVPHDPAEDREALHRLAWFCDGFSPVIGLEESDEPESLLFDLTGCAPLFGGEERLARQLQRHVQEQGLHRADRRCRHDRGRLGTGSWRHPPYPPFPAKAIHVLVVNAGRRHPGVPGRGGWTTASKLPATPSALSPDRVKLHATLLRGRGETRSSWPEIVCWPLCGRCR